MIRFNTKEWGVKLPNCKIDSRTPSIKSASEVVQFHEKVGIKDIERALGKKLADPRVSKDLEIDLKYLNYSAKLDKVTHL